MQSELDHKEWLEGDTGEEAQEAYRYFMRPDPNQREFLGPIEEEEDQLTGRVAKFRMAKVGMIRNAPVEQMREVKVYLGFDGVNYVPHLRIPNAKPLQGWYQDKHNDKRGSRPRPCFSEAILTEPYGGYCTVGCAFSLIAGELVDTPNGPRAIESLKVGDKVWGRTVEGRIATAIEAVTTHDKPEGYAKLTLEDGRVLSLTADHPVYFEGRWVAAGDLRPGDSLEDINEGRELSGLRANYSEIAEGLRQLFGADSFGKREREPGEAHRTDGGSKVGGDAGAYERGGFTPEGLDGRASFWAQIAGMARGTGSGRTEWGQWLSAIEAGRLDRSGGTHFSYAFPVGGLGGDVVGRAQGVLGLRTKSDTTSIRSRLLAGLSTIGRAIVGGQGLPITGRSKQTGGGPGARVSRGVAQRARVASVESVPGAVTVHDIQTTARNFYQRGVLVHNCYVNSGFRGYRGSGLISVPVGYGEQVREMLSKNRTSTAGYFSSFTDPFLPIENVYHNTEQGARAFTDIGLPVFFLSRLEYPGWAIDLLQQNRYSYAQKSLNTGNAEDWRKLSPGAWGLEEHIEQVAELRRRGIYTSIQVNPVVPGIVTHDDIRELFEKLARAGNNHVIVKFVEAGYSWAPAMVARLKKRFGPERGGAFDALFTENQAGAQRTIAEPYRMEGHRLYQKWATELGMTYATCYEYRRGKPGSGEPSWLSIGRELTTADQCHGHRVPMFTRTDLARDFAEVEECPPSGCMYCADDNNNEPRCGSSLFGAAKALRAAQYKHAVERDAIPITRLD